MAAENTLRYIKLDYTAHRDALLQRVRSRWSLSWNDFLANNFGRVIVDLVAWSTSTVAYTVNRAAAENFISTLTLRESAARIGALVSYKLKNPMAATVSCEARIADAAQTVIKLVKGTSISVPLTGTTALFELDADYTIAVGKTEPELQIVVIDPFSSGDSTINTQFSLVAGSANFDLADSTVDLDTIVSTGQYIVITNDTVTTAYRIIAVTATATSQYKSRLIVDTPWEGITGQYSAVITERRVRFVHGQTLVENSTVPPVDIPSYMVKLARYPVVENSVVVTVGGVLWPTVPTLAVEDSAAEKVEVRVLSDGSSAVIFGDGIFGSIPPSNAVVSVRYRTGGGTVGNVGVGVINSTIIGQQVAGQQTVQITNSWSPGEGGSDSESLSEARNNIPAHVRSNNRGVTAEDYQLLAARYNDPQFGNVRYARAVPQSTNSLLEGNTVIIYAWTTGPTGGLIPLSPGLKSSLTTYLRTKAIGTDYVTVMDGVQRAAPIAVRFKVFAGFDIKAATTSIKDLISSIVTANKPGDSIIFSDLVRQLDTASGVDSLTVATPLSDVQPSTTTEIFTPPNDDAEYALDLKVVSNYTYEGTLPITPLTPWCVKLYAGQREILVMPGYTQGTARIAGDPVLDGVARYNVGLKKNRPLAQNLTSLNASDFYYATDEQQLYRADVVSGSSALTPTLQWKQVYTGGSYIDLHTGKITISFKGSPRDIQAKLITAQGYDTDRPVNLYIGYSGENSLLKRREIRAALRAWSNGLKIGGSIFAAAVRGTNGEILLSASMSNVSDVVLTVPGVTGINKVALDSPSNSTMRIDAAATELMKIGAIVLNNLTE